MASRSEDRRLGDHFERATAGDDEEAIRGSDAASDECADQFVERIVSPDVFAQGDDRAISIAPGGAMDRARFGVERRFTLASRIEALTVLE